MWFSQTVGGVGVSVSMSVYVLHRLQLNYTRPIYRSCHWFDETLNCADFIQSLNDCCFPYLLLSFINTYKHTVLSFFIAMLHTFLLVAAKRWGEILIIHFKCLCFSSGRYSDRRRSPPRYSRSPPRHRSRSRGSRDYYSPPPKRREYSRYWPAVT